MPDTRPITDPPERLELAARYTIEAPISSGAMGAVYRGRDGQTGREVAIKRLLDLRHVVRFTLEARLLARLGHPRVVRVLDHFYEEETGMYLVMDLVDGINLGDLLTERGDPGLPASEAVEYVLQTCEALQYVHSQQIIHRDVKPQNMILGGNGVVLVDFGIARELEPNESATIGVGTPRYMAPEVLGGGNVSPRSDVFSLAATLWTLLLGEPPMYGARDQLQGELPEELDASLREALCDALDLNPDRRIASIASFAERLGSRGPLSGGTPLSLSAPGAKASRPLLEEIVRTAAGVFHAACSSLALLEPATENLVYQAAWGAGADEIVGVTLQPGVGIAGAAAADGQAHVVPDCKRDPHFAAEVAAGTGYVPNTMLVVPLKREEDVIGVLSVLDRRDGGSYGPDDVERAALFADLAVTSLRERPDS